MSLPIGQKMPPEVWELAKRAGRQNCLYWSNRWRRGTKPSVGRPAREMTNTIPGSPITATQPTATAQPVSVSEGFSFEGDDTLQLSTPPSPLESIIMVLVWEPPAQTTYGAELADPDGQALFHPLYVDSVTELRTQIRNDSGSLTRTRISITAQPMASVHAYRGADVVVSVRGTDGTAGHNTAIAPGTYSPSDGVLGGRVGTPDFYSLREIFLAYRAPVLPDSEILDLRESTARRHGIA